ncbi:28S ribosomal protein S21-like protein [Leptotrombidium deliense]|uniref:28S ribosomal protein S21-like protein n=1 Tax=Leptotrombidium deliense TaxID=299467 RepID=A0A443S6Y4_9ACAR|nr:28S ribosomal protein S21-like protein [Leptotrombidium deliense]
MKHWRFIGRTVIVKDGKTEEAFRVLNKIMGSEGFFAEYRRNQYYEKPFNTRRRINFEKCKAIYDEDMNRKINFLMRKNRVDPWPGR